MGRSDKKRIRDIKTIIRINETYQTKGRDNIKELIETTENKKVLTMREQKLIKLALKELYEENQRLRGNNNE